MCQFCCQNSNSNFDHYFEVLPDISELIAQDQASILPRSRILTPRNTESSAQRELGSSFSLEAIDIPLAELVIRGDSSAENIIGTNDDDRLFGNGGNDTLRGASGDDFLAGGQGNDRLIGGNGNDTIDGGVGRDTLRGFTGADQFNFRRPDNGTDFLPDFQPDRDRIFINQPGFNLRLNPGTLNSSRFRIGPRANNRSQRFIYDRPNGHLYFDPDGSGNQEQIRIATLPRGRQLRSTNFTLSRLATTPTPPSNPFDIDLNFQGSPITQAQRNIINRASQRWESIITEDIPDAQLLSGEIIDDLRVDISIRAIDGVGGILGQASPTLIRSDSRLPVIGVIELDQADLNQAQANGTLEDLFVHELGHVLGFGTLWADLGLVSGAGSNNPRFTGQNAVNAFNRVFNQNVASIPLEAQGGPGTRDSHWRESVFGNELLTGFIQAGSNPLSEISIASFADLGYQVDLSQADPFG